MHLIQKLEIFPFSYSGDTIASWYLEMLPAISALAMSSSHCSGDFPSKFGFGFMLYFTISTDRHTHVCSPLVMLNVAGVIDSSPIFPSTSSIVELFNALIYHYSIMVEEENGRVGIVTRAYFLKLLIRKK